MKTKIFYIVILIALGFNFQSYSQTEPLKIIDLSYNILENNDTSNINSDTLIIFLELKINKIHKAKKIHFSIGNTTGGSDIKTGYANMVYKNGSFCVEYDGKTTVTQGYSTYFAVICSKKLLKDKLSVTVYVEDVYGINSNVLTM